MSIFTKPQISFILRLLFVTHTLPIELRENVSGFFPHFSWDFLGGRSLERRQVQNNKSMGTSGEWCKPLRFGPCYFSADLSLQRALVLVTENEAGLLFCTAWLQMLLSAMWRGWSEGGRSFSCKGSVDKQAEVVGRSLGYGGVDHRSHFAGFALGPPLGRAVGRKERPGWWARFHLAPCLDLGWV